MRDTRSYYELLGIVHTADLHNIKKAFHRLSKLLHPDTTLLPVDEAARQFQQVCQAYELLSDPIKREAYDNYLKEKNYLGNKLKNDSEMIHKTSSFKKVNTLDNRRPFSGGELFSLLLLCFALCISLLLGVFFAALDGKELQATPSWLYSNQLVVNDTN